MSETTALLVVVVVTALGFDFTNGLHDTANAMAMAVSVLASVVVPVAFSVAILGQGRRDQPLATGGERTTGLLMLILQSAGADLRAPTSVEVPR